MTQDVWGKFLRIARNGPGLAYISPTIPSSQPIHCTNGHTSPLLASKVPPLPGYESYHEPPVSTDNTMGDGH